ncbi:MAG: DUF692 domain-containing protein [Gammaproteobacteria bacterium]
MANVAPCQARYPGLGFGLGLRTQHYQEILDSSPSVDWFEALTENYLVPGGKPLYYLETVRSRYPVALHGVSLSIGSADPLNRDYLSQLKALADRIEPAWISDHLCWTGLNGRNLHDLLPLPYTEEAVVHVSDRIQAVQDYLGVRLLIENVSSYLTYADSCMTEWEFLNAIAERADCLILLDINNLYVSSFNHDFDPHDYLRGVPAQRVQQFHIAGHRNHGEYLIDTHDEPVIERVWQLYADACRRFGAVSTLIERDDNIPPLAELLEELDHARSIAAGVAGQSPERAGMA